MMSKSKWELAYWGSVIIGILVIIRIVMLAQEQPDNVGEIAGFWELFILLLLCLAIIFISNYKTTWEKILGKNGVITYLLYLLIIAVGGFFIRMLISFLRDL